MRLFTTFAVFAAGSVAQEERDSKTVLLLTYTTIHMIWKTYSFFFSYHEFNQQTNP